METNQMALPLAVETAPQHIDFPLNPVSTETMELIQRRALRGRTSMIDRAYLRDIRRKRLEHLGLR